MKKYLMMFAAALFAFAACENEPETPQEPPVSNDKISVAPETTTFTPEGGSQQVMVTSSGEWTLSAEETYDWISADVESGVDGDIVTFTADANASGSQRVAEYTFTCGEATAIFTAISQSSDPETFELGSEPEMEISAESQRISVDVTTTLNYRTISSSLEEGVDWVTFNAALESENGATMYFDVVANEGEESRTAAITIAEATGEFEPFVVTLTQRPVPYIRVDKTDYFPTLEDTSLEIPVSANVEYDVTVSDSWLTYVSTSPEGVNTFTMSAATEERTATVTFTERNPLEGVEPVVTTVNVTQREAALVQYAINMSDARFFPEEWNNAAPLQNLGTLTLEALIRPDNFDKGGSGTVSTIMGIEGKFLVRIGDAGVPNNQIQIATAAGNYTDASLQLNTGEWYHLAVTYDNAARALNVYLNGELAYTTTTSYIGYVNFGVERGNETGSWGNVVRVFWVGYSYEPVRDFEGLMAEVRIWNRVLSSDEINAENHFYTVDPTSEGLVAYWKCNEGTGNTIKDYSSSGNDCVGQYGLHQTGSGSYIYTTGDPVTNWVEVALP